MQSFKISRLLIGCSNSTINTDWFTFSNIQSKDLKLRINKNRRSSIDLDIHKSEVFSSGLFLSI